MLVAGWGKDAKDLGYVGIVRCDHCKNHNAMHLYQIARKVSVFFVPVAKFGTRFYVVCPTCRSGSEVDVVTKDKILRESIELPDEETTAAIWNDIDARVLAIAKSDAELNAKAFDAITLAVREKYNPRHATYIATCYWEFLIDADKPQ